MSVCIPCLTTSHRPVFLINSRLSLFTATPSRSCRKAITITGHPFSRSYGVILPSSLTRVLSNTLGYSPRLPVSVCGTVHYNFITLRSYFSAVSLIGLSELGSSSHASNKNRRICLSVNLHMFNGISNTRLQRTTASLLHSL